MDETELKDYTGLTCTNLMIKLKILTKRMASGDALAFLTTREGNENLRSIFNKAPYSYKSQKIESNIFKIRIERTEKV